MMLDYNPQDAERKIFEPGWYEASIESTEEKKSKNGNDMIVIVFRARDGESSTLVTDYIVIPKALYKLKKLAVAFGKLDEFEAGKFDASKYHDRNLRLSIDTETKPGFDPKNVVKGYAVRGNGESETVTPF